MATKTAADDLKVKERVVAASDLPHIPAGTPGKVLTKVGLTWTRYTVLFDGGLVKSTLDRRALARPAEYLELVRRRELGLDVPSADGAGAASADTGGAPGAAVEAGATINGVAIPAHLLERSKNRRTVLAA